MMIYVIAQEQLGEVCATTNENFMKELISYPYCKLICSWDTDKDDNILLYSETIEDMQTAGTA